MRKEKYFEENMSEAMNFESVLFLEEEFCIFDRKRRL